MGLNMKKLLTVVLATALLLGICAFSFAESAAGNRSIQSNLALDLVIVIDESGSMNHPSNNKKYDEFGYRHDAAAALIGLCDTKYSRVAIVPFSTSVVTESQVPNVNKFLSVSLPGQMENRKRLVDILRNELKSDARSSNGPWSSLWEFSYRRGGDTDIGGALKRAVELQTQNPGSNRKLIVLLTDGGIDIDGRDTAAARTSRSYFDRAVEEARENGIRIYTVALKVDNASDNAMLSSASERTGGLYQHLNDALEIPGVFNNFFTTLVGSETIEAQKSDTKSLGDNLYETSIRVPNLSISEANILIPVGDEGQVKLFRPDDRNPVQIDNKKTFKYSTTYFTLIKILNPDRVGTWRVTYDTSAHKGRLTNLNQIAINVIFSYDVTPEIAVKPSVMHKTEDTEVSVRFRTPEGTLTSDNSLYNCGIKATLWIKKGSSDAQLRQVKMSETEGQDCFSYTFKARDVLSGARGGDTLRFVVKLQGDGMDMECELNDIRIENLSPKAENGSKPLDSWLKGLRIHDPASTTDSKYAEEPTVTIDLSQYVSEPDGETLHYTLGKAEGDDIFRVISLDGDTGELKVQTKDAAGRGTLHVTVDDGDGGTLDLAVPGDVTVVREIVKNSYKMDITAGEPKTNAAVTLTARLYDQNGGLVQDLNLLRQVNLKGLTLQTKYDRNGQTVAPALSFALNEQTFEFTAAPELSMNSAQYGVAGKVMIRDAELALVNLANFATLNSKPVFRTEQSAPAWNVTIHDPLKETADYKAEPHIVLDLAALVDDKDGEELTWTLVEPANGSGSFVSVTWDNQTDGKLKLTTKNAAGSETIRVRADDPETAALGGEGGLILEIPVSVRNIRGELGDIHYTASITPEELDKNTPYTLHVRLVKADGTPLADPDLDKWLSSADISGLSVAFVPNKAQDSPEKVKISLKADGGEWKDDGLTTGTQEGEYTLSGSIRLQDDIVITAWEQDPAWAYGNVVPHLVAEYAEGLQTAFEIDPWLWRIKDEKIAEMDLAEMFKDSATDTLTFRAYRVGRVDEYEEKPLDENGQLIAAEPDERTEEERWLDVLGRGVLTEALPLVRTEDEEAADEEKRPAAHILRLPNVKAGEHTVLLCAEDTDHERAVYVYRQNVTSQKAELIRMLLIIVACLVVVVILAVIIYWTIVRKSWSRQHGDVAIFVNSFDTGETKGFPRRGKNEVALTYLPVTAGSEDDAAAQIRKAAGCYKLRPGKSGSVIVRQVKKNNSAVTITVGMKDVTSAKKFIWPAETPMYLTGAGTENADISVEISRMAMNADPFEDGGYDPANAQMDDDDTDNL